MSTVAPGVLDTNYALDMHHSSVSFDVTYNGHAIFRSWFGQFDAAINNGTLSGSADVTSIAIGMEKFKEHVLAADFFDAASSPALTFTSTDITLSGDKIDVEGNLTIKGTSKPVVATGRASTAQDGYGNERLSLSLTAKIDRREFGLGWQHPLPDGSDSLGWDVVIHVELGFVKQAS